MRNDFYVYVLLDPRKPGDYQYGPLKFKHEPFYVGKGKGNRDKSHFRPGNIDADSKRYKNTKKTNKIRKIIEAGFYPAPVRIKSGVEESKAFLYEARAISLIGRGKHGPLVNCTDGGEGASGYKWSKDARERFADFWQSWHQGLTQEQRNSRAAMFSKINKERWESFTDSQRLAIGKAISDAAKRRTPEEQLALSAKFREIQLGLPEKVQKAKNAKVSKGNKAHHKNLTEEQRQEFREVRSKGVKRYWSSLTEEQRTKRAEAIASGYAKKSKKSLAKKNAKISSKIAEQHAKQSPFESRMRSYMVMCGVMLKHVGKGDDDALKAKLRARGERFYSKADNLEHKPSVLRDKVRKLIA